MTLLEEYIRRCGFDKLNTITKYPRILPFHEIKDKYMSGTLSTANYQPVPLQTNKMEVEVSELIDGNISRIIILGSDFLIADDENIVHARGDRVVSSDIVGSTYDGLKTFMGEYRPSEERFLILFGINYGSTFRGHERYTNIDKSGFALLDGFTIKVEDMSKLCDNNTVEQLTEWSNNLQAPFWSSSTKEKFSNAFGLMQTPKLKTITLDKVPTDPKKTLNWLWEFTDSKVVLDSDEEQAQFYKRKENKEPDIDPIPGGNTIKKDEKGEDEFLANMVKDTSDKAPQKFKSKKDKLGKSKGIVIRAADRTYIRKLRFEDYISLKKKK